MTTRKFGYGCALLLAATSAIAACSSGDDGPGAGASTGGASPGVGGAVASGGFASTGGSTSTGGLAFGTGGGIIDLPSNNNDSCRNQDVSVLFLIDRSGSMNCNLPPTTASADCEAMSPPAKVNEAEKSKWEVVSEVLGKSLDLLKSTDPDIHVRAAVSYFSIDGNCGANSTPSVPMDAVSDAQLTAIRDSVLAQKPKGGTPIVGGSILAYKHLHNTLGVTGKAHVVLITDGADSCGEYYSANPAIGPGDHVAELIGVQAPKAASVGIKTWVIGAPGSEPARGMLSNLAIAGNTRRSADCAPGEASNATPGDCHYDMTTGDFEKTLPDVLQEIMDVVTCRVVR